MLSKENIKLGIAPIAWTNDDMPDLGAENTFEQCISEMALAGFTGTEIGNKFPKEIRELKQALQLRNLEVASAWFSAYLTTDKYEKTEARFLEHRDFLYEMGAKVIVVSEQGKSIQGDKNKALFRDKPTFDNDEWLLLTEGLNKLGQLAKERNMKLVYHHHMGTGVQTTDEIDNLLDKTDESLVYLLYDTGHLFFSGEDHLSILKKYIHRIEHVHLKDIRDNMIDMIKDKQLSFLDAVRSGVFTVPGDGVIDFEKVFSVLANDHYEGWMVVEAEQDPEKANPLKYAQMAREYIRDTAGM